MLKWLKQKPGSGHRGVRATTDDPLATIQVHPITPIKTPFKRNSNPNEIYAVSRVNPLFEEEDAGKGALSPGNHSGSSGYDSGPSDDESQSQIPTSDDMTFSNPSVVILPNSSSSQKHLFSCQHELLIHQEARMGHGVGDASSAPNDSHQPILNVIKQNPAFVNSIAVAIEPPRTGRPLTPIAESKVSPCPGRTTVTAIPVPLRNIEPPARRPGDNIGAAKLIQRNSNYVQSIRIVPTSKGTTAFTKRNPHHPSNKSGPSLIRKPSVTFSETVEVVDGKLIPTSRRQSLEQDSIVTDSLLMMTSSHHLLDTKFGKRTSAIPSALNHEGRRHDVTDARQHAEGLAIFSDSLSRNRIVKQVMTRSSASPQPDEVGNEENSGNEEPVARRPRNISTSSKSSFGGIADHYAAAKEIAKEIDSYSQGTTKSTRINMVKDLLLSSRGRLGVGLTSSGSSPEEILRVDGHSPTLVTAVVHLKSPPPPPPLPLPASSPTTTIKPELTRGEHGRKKTVMVEVQPQVYVKANDKNVTNTPSHLRVIPGGHPHDRGGGDEEDDDGGGGKLEDSNTNTQPQLTRSTLNYKHVTATRSPLDVDSHYRQDAEGQVQVPIYEALPPGKSLHFRDHSHDDSDSGNSTDRSPKEEHSGDEAPVAVPKATVPIPAEASSASPSVNNPPPNDIRIRSPGEHPPSHSNDKVMIVSGDSQNMVVDLSAVPLDLREAIISGTAILALPDELNQRLEPGYTMIAIPQDHEYEILPSPKNYHPPHPKDPKEGSEGRDNYATKNLAQVWDVMQHKSKGKRITTVLPFHPNQDSHTTADFTIEGQPLARQTKRVKRLKTRRCCCRVLGIFLFLIAFLGVIVTLSLVYTKGKHYFGPV